MSSNNFNFDELRKWYSHEYRCRITGKNDGNAFHHAIQRARKYSNSLFNATLVHNQTHLDRHGEICKREQTEKFIEDNIYFLMKQGYQPNETDTNFIIEHDLQNVLERVLNKI